MICGPEEKLIDKEEMGIAVQYIFSEAKQISGIGCCWALPHGLYIPLTSKASRKQALLTSLEKIQH